MITEKLTNDKQIRHFSEGNNVSKTTTDLTLTTIKFRKAVFFKNKNHLKF